MVWEVAWDQCRKRWYYQDIDRGLSQWERPAGCSLKLPSEAPSSGSSPKLDHLQLPEGWCCGWDDRNKRRYYFCHNTGERSWTPPEGWSIQAATPEESRPEEPRTRSEGQLKTRRHTAAYKKGDQVEIWSNSMRVWASGIIDLAAQGDCVLDGYEVRKGAIKVLYGDNHKRAKWVMPEDVPRQVRRPKTVPASSGDLEDGERKAKEEAEKKATEEQEHKAATKLQAVARARCKRGARRDAQAHIKEEELQVRLGSEWTPYLAKVQQKARKARLRGKTGFDVTLENGGHYHVNLTTMQQVSRETKRCRPVRWSSVADLLDDVSDGSLDSEDLPKCWEWDHELEPRGGWQLELIFANGEVLADYGDPAGIPIQSALDMASAEDLMKGRDLKDRGAHSKLVLLHAWRIQHKQRWLKFLAEYRDLEEQVDIIKEHYQRDDATPEERGIVVTDLDSVLSSLPGTCDEDVNEKFLLHGTQPQHVLTILQNGMSPHFSSMKGLFGAGVYLADRPEKANQYATRHCPADPALEDLSEFLYPPETEAQHTEDVFYMFVCRTALGFPNVTENVEQSSKLRPHEPVFPSPEDKRRLSFVPGLKPQRAFHSLIGSQPGFRFREYVVYEGGYVYPEYLVAYVRR